jgi:hypothetical protein
MAMKQLPDGRWSVDVMPGGRRGRRVRKTLRTKTEALAWERWVEDQHAKTLPWNSGHALAGSTPEVAEAQRLMSYGETAECRTRRRRSKNPIGRGSYTYVMRCPAHTCDLYKIGFTTLSPEDRANDLSRATATPVRFEVVEYWAVSDAKAAEASVFEALKQRRANGSREFFFGRYFELRRELLRAIAPWLFDL